MGAPPRLSFSRANHAPCQCSCVCVYTRSGGQAVCRVQCSLAIALALRLAYRPLIAIVALDVIAGHLRGGSGPWRGEVARGWRHRAGLQPEPQLGGHSLQALEAVLVVVKVVPASSSPAESATAAPDATLNSPHPRPCERPRGRRHVAHDLAPRPWSRRRNSISQHDRSEIVAPSHVKHIDCPCFASQTSAFGPGENVVRPPRSRRSVARSSGTEFFDYAARLGIQQRGGNVTEEVFQSRSVVPEV